MSTALIIGLAGGILMLTGLVLRYSGKPGVFLSKLGAVAYVAACAIVLWQMFLLLIVGFAVLLTAYWMFGKWTKVKKYWTYAKYILSHKWNVFQACCKLGMPLIGVFHDLSKFLPCEFQPYMENFYGGYEPDNLPPELMAAYDRAWLHHQNSNDHHWQYWHLECDNGGDRYLDMSEKAMKHMVADWMAMSKKFRNHWSPLGWYTANKDKIKLSDATRAKVEDLLETLDEKYGPKESLAG